MKLSSDITCRQPSLSLQIALDLSSVFFAPKAHLRSQWRTYVTKISCVRVVCVCVRVCKTSCPSGEILGYSRLLVHSGYLRIGPKGRCVTLQSIPRSSRLGIPGFVGNPTSFWSGSEPWVRVDRFFGLCCWGSIVLNTLVIICSLRVSEA